MVPDHIAAIGMITATPVICIAVYASFRWHPTVRPSEQGHNLPGALVPRGEIDRRTP